MNIVILALIGWASAQTVTVYPPQTTSLQSTPATITITRSSSTSDASDHDHDHGNTASQSITAISDCHYHGTTQFCMADDVEGIVVGAPTKTKDAPTEYTGCHTHAEETFCLSPSGEEVQFSVESVESSGEGESGGENCHFHAGVEHCTGGSHSTEASCGKVDRDYNIPLRIGLIFAILATSAIGCFGPIVLNKAFKLPTTGMIFTVFKQFGTGVIISTAFVHLITHANLMWANECIGELSYEGTGSALTMAGILVAFVVEYMGSRILNKREQTLLSGRIANSSNEDIKSEAAVQVSPERNMEMGHSHSHGLLDPEDTISVVTMELGIIFHSILIGITLVVAGDSFFITLFIVIVFHQAFEGVALGSRIATLKDCSILKRCLMATAFSIITPIGMAIGIGVLSKFNGNDKSTLIAMGTLDSFSAGILIWTGLVEMWCNDWLFGQLSNAGVLHTAVGFISLIAGMVLMSVLGKWA